MFKGFFSAAAFEQRERERERRKLVKELEEIDKQRRYFAAREPIISARLEVLAGRDLADFLLELRANTGARLLSWPKDDPSTWSPHRQAYEAIGAKK
jgi:hypothetical protein